MKLTNTILVLAITAGTVWAQGPAAIKSTKDQGNAAPQNQNSKAKAAVVSMLAQSVKPAEVKKPASTQASKPSAAKPAVVSASQAPIAKPSVQPVKANGSQPVAKPSVVPVSKSHVPAPATQPKAAVKVAASKPPVVKTIAVVPTKKAPAKAKAAESKTSQKESSPDTVSVEKAPEPAKNDKTTKIISANGRRDPFISPVISQSAVGSGCSSGKRCLAVDQISLKGVVKSETGMIAVVVNAVDKAYFLRENDPVFDGYVLKITGDSIVFKETVQDKLGKPFTKEVTKKISTPAV